MSTSQAPNTIAFDIDGTLADNRWRITADQDDDIDGSLVRAASDTPVKSTIALLHSFHGSAYDVVFVTGRRERFRRITAEWLDKHVLSPIGHRIGAGFPLLMRDNEDDGPNGQAKVALLEGHFGGLADALQTLWSFLRIAQRLLISYGRRASRLSLFKATLQKILNRRTNMNEGQMTNTGRIVRTLADTPGALLAGLLLLTTIYLITTAIVSVNNHHKTSAKTKASISHLLSECPNDAQVLRCSDCNSHDRLRIVIPGKASYSLDKVSAASKATIELAFSQASTAGGNLTSIYLSDSGICH